MVSPQWTLCWVVRPRGAVNRASDGPPREADVVSPWNQDTSAGGNRVVNTDGPDVARVGATDGIDE